MCDCGSRRRCDAQDHQRTVVIVPVDLRQSDHDGVADDQPCARGLVTLRGIDVDMVADLEQRGDVGVADAHGRSHQPVGVPRDQRLAHESSVADGLAGPHRSRQDLTEKVSCVVHRAQGSKLHRHLHDAYVVGVDDVAAGEVVRRHHDIGRVLRGRGNDAREREDCCGREQR